MFRKAFQLKKELLSQFPFGNIVNFVHFLYIEQKNDVKSQSYKEVDNSNMKQGIEKILTIFSII